jgi:hypothetical protein
MMVLILNGLVFGQRPELLKKELESFEEGRNGLKKELDFWRRCWSWDCGNPAGLLVAGLLVSGSLSSWVTI